jgi:predicted nucleic acid-binding protein
MGAVVLDSSVLIGFVHADDVHHLSASHAIKSVRDEGDEFVLPATVLSELMVGYIRNRPASARAFAQQLVAGFGPVRDVDQEVAYAAAELRAGNRGLRLPDALVIATGILAGATVLTCDARLATVDHRVRVVPPR